LRKTKAMGPILDIIEFHHEQWLGHGYPTHLKAENIPYLARVVSVVDAFDAMTSKRAYGQPKTPSAALLEIQNCAGTQFDPELARNFVDWIRHHRIPAPKRIAA
jgi:response regulator RpfG family c-di-GMP phosphodiesterase